MLSTVRHNTTVEAAPAASTASVSEAVIALAAVTRFSDEQDCFRWLYNYGAEPLTRARVQSDPVINLERALALETHSKRHLTEAWDNWIKTSENAVQPRYKLYISPEYDQLDHCFDSLSPYLADPAVSALKIVAKRWMAVRPDKFIVYFHSEAARSGWVARIAPAIGDIAANPTPFTYPVTQTGILSFATDPLSDRPASWRSETARVIAGLIIAAQGAKQSPDQIIASIHFGLSARDIDVENWC